MRLHAVVAPLPNGSRGLTAGTVFFRSFGKVSIDLDRTNLYFDNVTRTDRESNSWCKKGHAGVQLGANVPTCTT